MCNWREKEARLRAKKLAAIKHIDPDRTDFTESEVVGTLRELSEWRAILNTKPKVRVVEFESESESESRSDSRSGSELEFESDVEVEDQAVEPLAQLT